MLNDDSSPSELKTKSEQMSEKEQQLLSRRQHDADTAEDTDSKNTTAMTIASNGNHHHAGEHVALPPTPFVADVAVRADADDDGGGHHIKHISGGLNVDDLYALPNKRKTAASDAVPECTSSDEGGDEKGNHEDVEDKDANKDLPPGWEKHEDNNGPYYWHIKSGTIQREPPKAEQPPGAANKEPKTPSSSATAVGHQSFMPHGDGGDKAVSNGSSFNSINSYYNMTKDGSRIQVWI